MAQLYIVKISGSDGGVLAAINASETDLHGVMEILKTMQDSKRAILGDVTYFVRDLKEMVGDVQHIALQVRMLSFNAAIEAAHAGKAGAGFTVVASEMRQLADLSAQTGAKMVKNIEKISVIDATLTDIFRADDRSTDADALAIIKADATIGDVVARFKQLTVSLSHAVQVMESESSLIRGKISDAMVELQFQDRASQILAHIVDNLNALNATVEGNNHENLDAEIWLREMSQKFSTQEEFDNLLGKSGSNPKTRDMTFF